MLETEASSRETAVDVATRIALLESENERLRADVGHREQRIVVRAVNWRV